MYACWPSDEFWQCASSSVHLKATPDHLSAHKPHPNTKRCQLGDMTWKNSVNHMSCRVLGATRVCWAITWFDDQQPKAVALRPHKMQFHFCGKCCCSAHTHTHTYIHITYMPRRLLHSKQIKLIKKLQDLWSNYHKQGNCVLRSCFCGSWCCCQGFCYCCYYWYTERKESYLSRRTLQMVTIKECI